MYVTSTALNIRAGPGTDYATKGTYSKGDEVCVVSTSGGWAELSTGYYVSAQYLTTKAPDTPTPSPDIIVNHTKIRDALLTSQWKAKADSLTVAYDVAIGNGYPINAAIGLMANLIHEGNYGVVEYTFSKSHYFDFYLPSGSTNGKAKTIKDIEYLRDWTTDKNAGSVKLSTYTLYKGSCGFGSIQWSYTRRVGFAKACLQIMSKDSDVTDTNWAIAEAKYIAQELKTTYYTSISNAAKKYNNTVEAWAEAFTDYYERPAGSDGNMSASGTACKTRRATARSLYDYLSSKKAFD